MRLGSDILTLFHTDLAVLGNINGYAGWQRLCLVQTASGLLGVLERLAVEVRLCDENRQPWSLWFMEDAVIRQASPDLPRLSGGEMRDYFYFGTSAGNRTLSVSSSKYGMCSLLN